MYLDILTASPLLIQFKIWKHWIELVKRNINSLRQDSKWHAEQLPIYIKNDGPDVHTLRVRLSQSVCGNTDPQAPQYTHGLAVCTARSHLQTSSDAWNVFRTIAFSEMCLFKITLWQRGQSTQYWPRNIKGMMF